MRQSSCRQCDGGTVLFGREEQARIAVGKSVKTAVITLHCQLIGMFSAQSTVPISIPARNRLLSNELRRKRKMERRGRDSNPRYPCGYTGFRDRHNRPLCHLSGKLDPFPKTVAEGEAVHRRIQRRNISADETRIISAVPQLRTLKSVGDQARANMGRPPRSARPARPTLPRRTTLTNWPEKCYVNKNDRLRGNSLSCLAGKGLPPRRFGRFTTTARPRISWEIRFSESAGDFASLRPCVT